MFIFRKKTLPPLLTTGRLLRPPGRALFLIRPPQILLLLKETSSNLRQEKMRFEGFAAGSMHAMERKGKGEWVKADLVMIGNEHSVQAHVIWILKAPHPMGR